MSPRFELPDQRPNSNAVQQPSGPAQTESVDPCGPVYDIGGSIRPPVPTHTPDPKFSKEASNVKFSGNVIVGLIVGRDGKPCNVHLVRGNGIIMMGVDESAVKSVQHYKFKPAMQNGKPVAVNLKIEVNFNYSAIHQ
jgi:protein TonB